MSELRPKYVLDGISPRVTPAPPLTVRPFTPPPERVPPSLFLAPLRNQGGGALAVEDVLLGLGIGIPVGVGASAVAGYFLLKPLLGTAVVEKVLEVVKDYLKLPT